MNFIIIPIQTNVVSCLADSLITFRDFLLVGGIVLIIAWQMIRLRQRKTKNKPKLTAREILERQHQVRGTQGQLEKLMIEVEQLAKRFSLQLDAKARRLENLLSEADQRIATLRHLTSTENQAPPPEAPPEVPPEVPPAVSPEVPRAVPRKISPSPARTPPIPDVSPETPPKASPVSPTPPIREDPLAESVYRLADAGMPPQAIAAELDEHIGKVELILALRQAQS